MAFTDDRAAIVSHGGTHTRRQLTDAADRIAAGLLAGAPDRSDLNEARVAIALGPAAPWLATLLGIWRAGGVAVPLPASHPAPELEHMLRDAGVSLIVTDTTVEGPLSTSTSTSTSTTTSTINLAAEAAAVPRQAFDDLLSTSPREAPPHHAALPYVDPRRRAMILYTSGTTARPKGVVTTHANIDAQVSSLVRAWEWTSDDRTLLVLPLHHVHGIVNVVLSAWTAGAVCEMSPRFDAGATWSRLASGDITVFTAVPTIYHRLIAAWDDAAPDVRERWSAGASRARVMMSGSAALPVTVLERWREITGHTLLERYGMTEIGMGLSNPLHGERRPGAVGTPLPGVEARLVDDAGVEVAPGAPGDVEIRSSGVFLEYWQQPDATRAALRDGWFRTGDVAVIENGAYRLLGRRSTDILKVGGHKVSALEIEDTLRAHPAIADCGVVGLPDDEWGERIAAAVELRTGERLELEALQAWARTRLAAHKMPRTLLCGALPRNAMGKVVKPDLVARFKR